MRVFGSPKLGPAAELPVTRRSPGGNSLKQLHFDKRRDKRAFPGEPVLGSRASIKPSEPTSVGRQEDPNNVDF